MRLTLRPNCRKADLLDCAAGHCNGDVVTQPASRLRNSLSIASVFLTSAMLLATGEEAMHTALALISVAVAFLLVWLVAQMIDAGAADSSIVGGLIRKNKPTAFWALIFGLVMVIVLLLLLVGALLVGADRPQASHPWPESN